MYLYPGSDEQQPPLAARLVHLPLKPQRRAVGTGRRELQRVDDTKDTVWVQVGEWNARVGVMRGLGATSVSALRLPELLARAARSEAGDDK